MVLVGVAASVFEIIFIFMTYQGGKGQIVGEFLPIIEGYLHEGQTFYDLFVGGGSVVGSLDWPDRVANDFNPVLVAMYRKMQEIVYFDERTCEWVVPSGVFPAEVSKENYYNALYWFKGLQSEHPAECDDPAILGFYLFCCSYKVSFAAGYAGPEYQAKAFQSLVRDFTGRYHQGLRGVEFHTGSYDEVPLRPNSVIFCDPPYINTAGYGVSAKDERSMFNHDAFHEWCCARTHEGHTVFLTEYTAPDCFECLWQQIKLCNLAAVKGRGSRKYNVEHLYICRG